MNKQQNKIPENWEVVNLSSIASLKGRIGWQGLTRSEYLQEGYYFLVTGTDFNNFKINWNTCVFVNKDRYDQDENIQLKEKDILITKDGSIGKVAFVDKLPGKATLNSGIFVVRPTNKNYLPEYLFRIMQSTFFDSFMKVIAGSTIAHLYQRDFVNFEFPIPPKEEQLAISTIFSKVDKQIDIVEREIRATERVKEGIMVKLLGNPSWEKIELNGNIKIIGGFAFKSPDFGKKEKNNIPLIKISEIQDGEVIFTGKTSYVPEKFYEFYKNFQVKEGDVLIALSGATTGKIGVVKENIKKALLNQRVGKFEIVDNQKIDKEFFFHLSQSSYFVKEIFRKIGKSAQGNLSPSEIEKVSIRIPPLSEQKRIANILSTIDKKLELERNRKGKLERLKKGLMNELLTGNKRVNVKKVLEVGK